MKSVLIISVVILSAPPARGQAPEEAFHDGARLFVGGELEQALGVVTAGLAEDPDNTKLEALKLLIEEEEERQSGTSGSQDQDEQRRNEEDSESDRQNPSQGSQEQEPETRSDQQQEQPGEKGRPPEPESPHPEQEDRVESQQRESSAAGNENNDQIGRAQALRILQALQNEEEQLLREVQKVKGKARRVEKDW